MVTGWVLQGILWIFMAPTIKMKHMRTSILKKFGWAFVLITIAWSCRNEDAPIFTPAQQQVEVNSAAQSNSQIVTATQDVSDITASAITTKGLAGGRKLFPLSAREAHHGCDPTITANFSVFKGKDSLAIKGNMVIDYGDGSTCTDSTEVMKGKILDTFDLILSNRDSVSFSLTDSITFDGFQKDSIQLAGLIVKHSTQWQTTDIDIHDARITYADGTFVNFSGSLESVLGRISVSNHNDDADQGNDGNWDDHDGNQNDSTSTGSDSVSNPGGGDHWSYGRTVTGSLSGVTRDGSTFTAEITSPIVYDFSCSMKVPVSGTITLTVAGVESTIDYGNGSCNRKYTIDCGGKSTDYHFSDHRWH